MISKLIVHAENREDAINLMDRALREYKVIGIPTNIKFLRRALNLEDFQKGDFDTSVIEKNQEELLQETRQVSHNRLGTIAVVKVFLETLKMRLKRGNQLDPWQQRDMFRLNHRS